MKIASLLIASLGWAHAFQTMPYPQRANQHHTSLNNMELNPIDEMCVENMAEFCLHETCDIEEYEALINQLEDQRDYFIGHVANVESLMQRLKSSNHPEHNQEEVKLLVESIKSTLADKSAMSP